MKQDAPGRDVFQGPLLCTFARYALPSLLGLLAISTASIVDGFFVGRYVGPEALAAVNLQLPYFALLFGAALMLAFGGSIRAGHSLGAGYERAASATFSKSVVAAVLLGCVAALAGNVFDLALYRALGAPPHLFGPMREYFRVISCALVVQLGTLVVYYFVRLDGRPLLATVAVVTGAITNIGLNALLVGGLGLGLSGAASATGLAQLVQLAVLLSHFGSGRGKLRFSLLQRDWAELIRSAYGGASELVNEASVGLLALLLNWLLVRRVGVHGVAAFTVVSYATYTSLMVAYGAADALHLLVSQNVGAGNVKRAGAFFRCALGCVIAFGATLAGGLLAFGDAWIHLFVGGARPGLTAQAAAFLGCIWPLLLFNGANVLMTVYLAATHRPGPAGLLALCRSLLAPAAFLLLLSWLEVSPFLLALPLAEAATLLFAITLLGRSERSAAVELAGSQSGEVTP